MINQSQCLAQKHSQGRPVASGYRMHQKVPLTQALRLRQKFTTIPAASAEQATLIILRSDKSMLKQLTASLLLLTPIAGCTDVQQDRPLTLAVSQGAGCEYLYLAQVQGFFKAAGINVNVQALYSMPDAQRAFTQGRVDGLASSLSEVVQAAGMIEDEIHLVLITDYADGSDVIVGQAKYPDVRSLHGKKVAAEPGSKGIMLLSSALAYYDMTISDIEFVALDPPDIVAGLLAGTIDAGVTHPPFAAKFNGHTGTRTLFSSAQLPGQIADVVSFKGSLGLSSEWISKFQIAWQMALDYVEQNPIEAEKIMIEHEHINVAEFRKRHENITFVSVNRQAEAVALINQSNIINHTCRTLGRLKSIRQNCQSLVERINLRLTR
ncbi:MAG: NitT/TauT family transport system substrate-binding protein [Candidatus Azotimanducaceae bacterium]|jgi:NitT/TauT family transport system substrate-binding protein